MKKIIKRNKKYLLFVGMIILVGFICGLTYYMFLDSNIRQNVIESISKHNSFDYNFIFKNLVIMSIILVTSFFIIGIPISIFYLFYESLSIGFVTISFFGAFGLNGITYILFYILINKLIIFILMVIFTKRIINIGRFIIGSIIFKKDLVIKNKLIFNLKSALYIILFVVIINIILYFISPLIFTNFNNLLTS